MEVKMMSDFYSFGIGVNRTEVIAITTRYFNEFRKGIDKISQEKLEGYCIELQKEISCLYGENHQNIDSVINRLTRIGRNTKLDYVLKCLRNKAYTPKRLNDFLDDIVPLEIFDGEKIKIRSSSETRLNKFKNTFSSRGRFINEQAKKRIN